MQFMQHRIQLNDDKNDHKKDNSLMFEILILNKMLNLRIQDSSVNNKNKLVRLIRSFGNKVALLQRRNDISSFFSVMVENKPALDNSTLFLESNNF